MKNVSSLLAVSDVVDWNALIAALKAAAAISPDAVKKELDELKRQTAVKLATMELELRQADDAKPAAAPAAPAPAAAEGAKPAAKPAAAKPADKAPDKEAVLQKAKDDAAAQVAAKESQLQQAKIVSLLNKAAKQALADAPAAGKVSSAIRFEIVYGFNDLVKEPKFADAPELKPLAADPAVKEVADGLPVKRGDWSDQDVRKFNRAVMETVFPTHFGKRSRMPGPPTVVTYSSQGESIGEIGLMLNRPRTATCIVYGHPEDKTADTGDAELVRIPADVFRRVIDQNPAVKQKFEKQVAKRKLEVQELLLEPPWQDSRQILLSDQFEAMGLIQGQQLMLIDLDRCTRCDECVQACVNTHADGKTRLFLDGPRIGKYMAPVTCRSCLNPVCMVNCPVGSIHRGDNKQMVIENWCIGCGACAESCPYGSIQMHDIGVVPTETRDVRYLRGSLAANNRWHEA
ncbi:MAG: 4Fe-4S binding protein, partial [Planctomycetia bacterium]